MNEPEIREAKFNELDRVVELGRKFLADGPYRRYVEDNPKQAAKLALELNANPNARILVALVSGEIVGVLAFVIFDHYLSGVKTANEVIWYVLPDHRGRAALELLWAAESEAERLGAVNMQLTAPSWYVGEIYQRCGYSLVEIGYQAELKKRIKANAGD